MKSDPDSRWYGDRSLWSRLCKPDTEANPIPGRILALDYGKRRIGLAISDALGVTAQGLDTLRRTRIRDDFNRLAALASEHDVALLLFGDPLHMSGERSRGSEEVREFAARLGEKTGIPVEFWDERLTTKEANRVLRESGLDTRNRRTNAVDRLAAVLLLESYLEWRSLQQEESA